MLFLLRLCAIIALAVSAALYNDYVSFNPSFCGAGSGCDTVRRSGFGYLNLEYLMVFPRIIVPVPLIGLLGFGSLLVASLFETRIWRRIITPALAITGGVLSLVLIVLQAGAIGKFCTLCLVVDVCGLIAAVAAILMLRTRRVRSQRRASRISAGLDEPPDSRMSESERFADSERYVYSEAIPDLEAHGRTEPPPPIHQYDLLKPWAWWVLGVLAVAVPLGWPAARPAPPLPAQIRALYEPGKINVIEFADFECPHCRGLHPRLMRLLEAYGDRVHFQRFNFPLPSHPNAQNAARAEVCADQQGQSEAMANRLFSGALDPESILKAAQELGLDGKAFKACLKSPETDAQIEREAALLREAGLMGLPTTYIGSQVIVGAQPDEVFVAALESAAHGEGEKGLPAPVYFGIALLLTGAVVWVGRMRSDPSTR